MKFVLPFHTNFSSLINGTNFKRKNNKFKAVHDRTVKSGNSTRQKKENNKIIFL